MFPFSRSSTDSSQPEEPSVPQPVHPLDALTHGAFSAPTAGERAAAIRQWLTTNPSIEQVQTVFKELSAKDKGAARPLRERLDEHKRQRDQTAIADEWAERARALLALERLNIADAMAWQRDAARAGAPLSREPLATLKTELAERVHAIEDVQHRVQVQREAAVLLAQRIELLSTKPWGEALAQREGLQADVAHWVEQAQALRRDAAWPNVDVRHPPQLESAQTQLQAVWDAFAAAVAQAEAAATDVAAPLPPVPVWADELRLARGLEAEASAAATAPKPAVDPQRRAEATQAVQEALTNLEQALAQGHGKASAGAAANLRQQLKDHGRFIAHALDQQAHLALGAAGELEGWQRWRADQLRQELVAKAEGLLHRPDGQALGGRKMQEQLRALREQWKQTDQGGVPNHALWRRFDEACNVAHKVVEGWHEKVRAEAAEHMAQRQALIAEVLEWAGTQSQAADGDWRRVLRGLQQFEQRWRDAGHVGEKAFAEVQAQWKAAMQQADAPLRAAREEGLAQRQALIAEAQALSERPQWRIDEVKALQQRWQTLAHAVPLEHRQEQKLWDAFRQPLDAAFARKNAQREQAAAALGARDRSVLAAAQALQQASSSGDAQAIRAAQQALDAALHSDPAQTPELEANPAAAQTALAQPATENVAVAAGDATVTADQSAVGSAPKPVRAVRGDDRPGLRPASASPVQPRPGRPGQRDERGPRDVRRDRPPREWGGARHGSAEGSHTALPRLGDAAFRAQRDALEQAQATLRKLAAQAHGEVVQHVLHAWQQRDAQALPAQAELGKRVKPADRQAWVNAVQGSPQGDASTSLLRLEMAAELPTPASHLEQRRALQLQMLTRRNDPAPAQTWAADLARVLASTHDEVAAQRLQSVLRNLLRG